MGPFRWESVPCPKGIFFFFLVPSVTVTILVYLHIIQSFTLSWLGGGCLTSHLFYLRLLPFSSPGHRQTGGYICFPGFSNILLAEADPFAQWLWKEEEASGMSQIPRQGSMRFGLHLCRLHSHHNPVTPVLLLFSFYRWGNCVAEHFITCPKPHG